MKDHELREDFKTLKGKVLFLEDKAYRDQELIKEYLNAICNHLKIKIMSGEKYKVVKK